VLHLRPAGIGDLAVVLPRTLALNAHEGIAVDPPALEAALDRLLRDPRGDRLRDGDVRL
jgi:hypothetical protein